MNLADINQFKNAQSMTESAQILMAAAVIVRMALGQIVSTNTLCDKEVFSESERKKIIPVYEKFMKLISKSHDAYYTKAQELEKSE